MADIFNTQIGTSGPATGGGQRAVPSAPPIQQDTALVSGLDNLAKLAMTGLSGAASAKTENLSNLELAVDDATRKASEAALGTSIDPNDPIEMTMENLATQKEAAVQSGSGDAFTRFNLQRAATMSALYAANPHLVEKIKSIENKRGLVDPSIALVKDRIEKQKAEELFNTKVDDAAIEEAAKHGYIIYNNGDINQGRDRKATLQKYQEVVAIRTERAALDAKLGIVTTPSGEQKSVMRPVFLDQRDALNNNIFAQVQQDMTPITNNLTALISTPGVTAEQLDSSIKGVFTIANGYKNARLTELRPILNDAEFADVSAHIDSVINTMLSPIANVDTKDMNAVKASELALKLISNTGKVKLWTDAPLIASGAEVLGSEIMGKIIGLAMQDPGFNLSGAAIKVRNELTMAFTPTPLRPVNLIGSALPTTPTPTDQETRDPLGNTERKFAIEDRNGRVAVHFAAQREMIKQGWVIGNPAQSFSWIQTQNPMFEANYNTDPEMPSLSKQDKVQLLSQITSSNYLANLEQAREFHPEAANKIAAYAFDVVQHNISALAQELSGSSGPAGKADIPVEYSPIQGRFVLIGDMQVGGRIGSASQNINNPAARIRMDALNKSIPIMLATRDIKESYKDGTDVEFLNIMADRINFFRDNPEVPIDDGSIVTDRAPKVLTQTREQMQGRDRAIKEVASMSTAPAKEQDFSIIAPKEGSDVNETIKGYENRHLRGRDPTTGLWTTHPALEGGTANIGFGHKLTQAESTGKFVKIAGEQVSFKEGLTDEQVEALFNQDTAVATKFVNKEFPNLTDNQKKAVISLVYNLGQPEFQYKDKKPEKGFTRAYSALKRGDLETFNKQAFDREVGFTKINNKISEGLVARRKSEKELFLSGQEVRGGSQDDLSEGFTTNKDLASEVLAAINPVSSTEASSSSSKVPFSKTISILPSGITAFSEHLLRGAFNKAGGDYGEVKITNADLTKGDIGALRDMYQKVKSKGRSYMTNEDWADTIGENLSKTGVHTGVVPQLIKIFTDPKANMALTFGAASFVEKDGRVYLKDLYNFNPGTVGNKYSAIAEKEGITFAIGELLEDKSLGGYDRLRVIGYLFNPKAEGNDSVIDLGEIN